MPEDMPPDDLLPSDSVATPPINPASPSPASSPLSQIKGGEPNINSMVKEQIANLQSSRGKKKELIDTATRRLQERLEQQKQGPTSEEFFRIAQGFLSPTKTGRFSESLGNVAGVGADILKGRREANAGLEDLIHKYQLQGVDVDAEHLKEMISASKNLQGGAQSAYGKQALDEGLVPGTPEYANRVKQLSQYDIDVKVNKSKGVLEGEFDQKTGNFITPGGTVIPKAEITKDREQRQKLIDQKAAFKKIDKKTLKKAISTFDVTGQGVTGQFGKAVAGTFAQDTLDAQTKIYSQAIEGIQKALPPGPASDKDVAQAKATFPGFSSKTALENWLTSLEEMVDRHIRTQDEKYGSQKWFGASGAPSAPARGEGNKRNDLGETPSEQERMKNQAPPPAPKVGAILHGHRFLGGDPSKKENWEKV